MYATDVEAIGLTGTKAVLHYCPKGTETETVIEVEIPIAGEHNVYNALAAVSVANELGLTAEEMKRGIESVQTISGRSNLIHKDGITVIDDCYNANPVSMKASIDVLSKAPGRKIAVLGDMGELGTEEKELHYMVGEHFAGKEFLTTPMRKEVERCRLAFETAAEGKQVAMICSGDAGVYGMAGLMYELSEEWPDIEIKVIPGVTAATGGAAVLGAPLIHDFALISLSDLLTPWEKIEKRLLLASEADFVICLYNPGSHKRADYLEKACDLMLRYKAPETVCGIVSQIGRDGETSRTMTLAELRNTKVDMFTTVFIGNSQTKEIRDHMVTPRGYRYE